MKLETIIGRSYLAFHAINHGVRVAFKSGVDSSDFTTYYKNNGLIYKKERGSEPEALQLNPSELLRILANELQHRIICYC